MALVELDVRAAAERYLPKWTLDEDGTYRLAGAVADEVIDTFVAEVEAIFAFHLPDEAGFDVKLEMLTFEGDRIAREIKRKPRFAMEQINMKLRVE